VHVSTDCVFSGRLPAPARYAEDDPADPPDLYGRSKLDGEVRAEGALTLRTSIFGWELETRHGLLEWLVAQAGRTVDGYANAIFSGLEARALARVVGAVIREAPDLSGLYHVAAAPVSKLALLDNLNRALALDCEVRAVQDPVVNRALDPSRFQAHTRIPIPTWSSMIEDCARAAR
jgi:dTDP-4-dehydrorhamnose reductase